MDKSPELKRDESSPEEHKKTLGIMVEALVQAAPVLSRLGLKDDEAWGAYSAVFNALHRLGQLQPFPKARQEPDPR